MRRTKGFTALLFTVSLVIAGAAFAQQTDDMFVPEDVAPRVIIPVAGNAQGANGTFYRSDINVINLRNIKQLVTLHWRPQGQAGATLPLRAIEIPPNSGIGSEDFVNEILNGRTGLGSIEVTGVFADGTFDPGASLHVTARIWTPRPDGAGGTMSQTFPAVIGDQTPPLTQVKAILGLRRTEQYRLNVGMSNPSATTQIFRVTVSITGTAGTDTQTFEVTLPARSMEQRLVGGTATGVAQVIVEDIGGGAGDWHAWASSVDNQSGDAWSQVAFPTLIIQ
jgi:hypothetical protein